MEYTKTEVDRISLVVGSWSYDKNMWLLIHRTAVNTKSRGTIPAVRSTNNGRSPETQKYCCILGWHSLKTWACERLELCRMLIYGTPMYLHHLLPDGHAKINKKSNSFYVLCINIMHHILDHSIRILTLEITRQNVTQGIITHAPGMRSLHLFIVSHILERFFLLACLCLVQF